MHYLCPAQSRDKTLVIVRMGLYLSSSGLNLKRVGEHTGYPIRKVRQIMIAEVKRATTTISAAVRPLPGKVSAQYVTCGKSDCRCRNGQRHGPYYYRVWRDGDSIRKEYIKSKDVDHIRACCKAHEDMLRLVVQLRSERRRLTGNIRKAVTATKRLIRDPW